MTATDVGTYGVTATLNAGYKWSDGSEDTTARATWSIKKKAPEASDFTFAAPAADNLIYDGTAKEAKVTLKEPYAGIGDVTVKYYNDKGQSVEPVNVGTYIVKITAADGKNFTTAENLTDENWKFTVLQGASPAAPDCTFLFDGKNGSKLMGATADMEYSIDGGKTWVDCTKDITISTDGITSENGIQVRVKETLNNAAGKVKTIGIKENKNIPAAGKENCLSKGNTGKLTNVTADMEYSSDNGKTWTAITGDTVEGLAGGNYKVRYKATGTELPSKAKDLVIDSYIASAEKAITSFKIDDIAGVINEKDHTVAVTVPYGTDVTKLSPEIAVSPLAMVSPANGEVRDFTKPVTYAVTAENDTTQDYVVTVTVELPKLLTVTAPAYKTLTAFAETADAAIKELPKTVAITSENTAVKELVCEWTLVGNNYERTPGAVNTFHWKANTDGFNVNGQTVDGDMTLTNRAAIKLTIASPVLNADKTYDGTADVKAQVVVGTPVGVLQDDTVHVVVNKSVYDSKNAGDRKVTVSYEISGNDAWKYIAPERSVVNGKIVPKEVNVSGITAVSRVYDKDNKSVQLSADGAKVSGYIGSDTVTVDITGAVGTMADDKAGDNKPVAITGVKLSGDNGNYVLKEQPTGVTVNISKADGSVTAPTAAADLVYNGSEQTLINEAVSSTGEVHYKLENGTYSTDLPKAVNAGSYKVYYKVIGDENHNDVAEQSINVTVNKAKLIITVKDKSAYVNDKAPDLSKPEADKDYTVSGLKGEDKITEVPSLKYIGAENKEIDPDMTKAGTVTIGASGASAGDNYTVEYKTGTLTINNRRSSGGSTKYTVSAPKSTTGGSVKSDVSNAASGSTVNVTVTAEEGYKLDVLKVTDSKGNEIKVTDKGNGKYTFTMPSDKVEITPVFIKEASEIVNELPFKDVAKGAYYYDAVKWAKDNGITGGVSNDMFGSNASCTRGHIVTFLWRNAGSPEPKSVSSFSDVALNSYYAKAVAWAVENGITNGVGQNKFDPDAVCTRAQSVAFLYRAIGKQAGSKAQFSDVPSNSYYADAVAWAAANDVTNGIGSGLFGSGMNCTRSQIVTFLYRAQQAHA